MSIATFVVVLLPLGACFILFGALFMLLVLKTRHHANRGSVSAMPPSRRTETAANSHASTGKGGNEPQYDSFTPLVAGMLATQMMEQPLAVSDFVNPSTETGPVNIDTATTPDFDMGGAALDIGSTGFENGGGGFDGGGGFSDGGGATGSW